MLTGPQSAPRADRSQPWRAPSGRPGRDAIDPLRWRRLPRRDRARDQARHRPSDVQLLEPSPASAPPSSRVPSAWRARPARSPSRSLASTSMRARRSTGATGVASSGSCATWRDRRSRRSASSCAPTAASASASRRRKDGMHSIPLEPRAPLRSRGIARLCTLIPPPRSHLVRYRGVLAAHAKARSAIVPQVRTKARARAAARAPLRLRTKPAGAAATVPFPPALAVAAPARVRGRHPHLHRESRWPGPFGRRTVPPTRGGSTFPPTR